MSLFQTQIDNEMNYCEFAQQKELGSGGGVINISGSQVFHTAALAARYNLISNYRSAQNPNLKH